MAEETGGLWQFDASVQPNIWQRNTFYICVCVSVCVQCNLVLNTDTSSVTEGNKSEEDSDSEMWAGEKGDTASGL